MAGQQELIRITATSGGLAVGREQGGRGAWLCSASRECFELARRRRAFARALRRPVGEAELASLETELFGGR